MDSITCESQGIYHFALIQVFTSAVPFGDLSSMGTMVAMSRGKRPPRPKHPYVTGWLWKLI